MKFSLGSGFCRLLVTAAFAIIMLGPSSRLAAQTPIIKNIQAVPPAKSGISNREMQNICTSAIAALSNQPTTLIHLESVEKGMMHLSSTRPTDGTSWRYTCKIDGKEILLAKEDEAGQTDASKKKVPFRLTEDEIVITVPSPDGSEIESRFPR